MEPITVQSVSFEALEAWDYPRHKRYTYAYISDECIRQALIDPELKTFELTDSWSSLTENSSTLSDNEIHPKIIAKMVQILNAGGEMGPVEVEATLWARDHTGYCVIDGHHRLRAWKYVGADSLLATLRGDHLALEELLSGV